MGGDYCKLTRCHLTPLMKSADKIGGEDILKELIPHYGSIPYLESIFII